MKSIFNINKKTCVTCRQTYPKRMPKMCPEYATNEFKHVQHVAITCPSHIRIMTQKSELGSVFADLARENYCLKI